MPANGSEGGQFAAEGRSYRGCRVWVSGSCWAPFIYMIKKYHAQETL